MNLIFDYDPIEVDEPIITFTLQFDHLLIAVAVINTIDHRQMSIYLNKIKHQYSILFILNY